MKKLIFALILGLGCLGCANTPAPVAPAKHCKCCKCDNCECGPKAKPCCEVK